MIAKYLTTFELNRLYQRLYRMKRSDQPNREFGPEWPFLALIMPDEVAAMEEVVNELRLRNVANPNDSA